MATPRKTTTSEPKKPVPVAKKATTAKTAKSKSTAAKKPATRKKAAPKANTKAKKEEAKIESPVELTKLEYPFVCNFEKVSKETFAESIRKIIDTTTANENADNSDTNTQAVDESSIEDNINWIYDNIKLPERVSPGSSQYHFWFPIGEVTIPAGYSLTIPTGIKCFLARNWSLEIIGENFNDTHPGLGFDLVPPVAIVNPDDYIVVDSEGKEKEGQIYITVTNNNANGNAITVSHNSPFACGILRMFGISYNEYKEEA